jgi:hypothetical protein
MGRAAVMRTSVERLEAVSRGLGTYSTGRPCKYGHLAERSVQSRGCVVCARERARRAAGQNPDRVRATKHRYDERRRSDPMTWARHMASSTRCRARKLGVPFNLTALAIYAAIPKDRTCAALGIPLVFGAKLSRNSPSIDRHIPALGYVIGNISIISHRANAIKQDATDPNDLRRVAAYMESRAQRLAGESHD